MDTVPQNNQPVHHKVPFFLDVFRGAIIGDWAHEMGVAGYTTQAIISMIPIVGNICAIRDFQACLHKKDHLGATLNGANVILAFIPLAGAFPRTALIIERSVTLGSATKSALDVQHRTAQLGEMAPPQFTGGPTRASLIAFSFLSLFSLVVAITIGALTSNHSSSSLTGTIVATLAPLAVIASLIAALFFAGFAWIAGLIGALRRRQFGWLIALFVALGAAVSVVVGWSTLIIWLTNVIAVGLPHWLDNPFLGLVVLTLTTLRYGFAYKLLSA